MPSQFDEYRMKNTPLSDDEFNRRWRSLDLRATKLEDLGFTFEENQNALVALTLDKINAALLPIIESARAYATLGDLLRAQSLTSRTVAASGTVTFTIVPDDRLIFAAPLYVIAAASGVPDVWMAGQTLSYDQETGALIVALSNSRGTGTYADWTIAVAGIPPETVSSLEADDVSLSGVTGMAALDVQAGFAEHQADIVALQADTAPLDSPALTGTPTTTAPPPGDSSTRIATTGFIAALLGEDPNFVANVTAAVASALAGLATKADIASPTLTGVPTAPTPAAGDSTTKIATTAYVKAEFGDIATVSQVRAAPAGKYLLTAASLRDASAFVTMSDAFATIPFDWAAGINFYSIISASRIMGNPTNGIPGTWRTIILSGATGTQYTLTFANQYWGEIPVLTDVNNARLYLLTVFCYSPSHFIVSAKRGF